MARVVLHPHTDECRETKETLAQVSVLVSVSGHTAVSALIVLISETSQKGPESPDIEVSFFFRMMFFGFFFFGKGTQQGAICF